MPQIIEYTAENTKLQPTEVGIEATAGAARRVNAAFNEAAGLKQQTGHIFARGLETVGNAAVSYIDHQQISAGSAAFAGLTAKATQDWNDRNKTADPRDPSTGKSWLQNVLEPSLQQFQQGFLTDKSQQWAAAHVEHLRNHFTTKVASDMSRKAGEAVSMEQGQALQGWANTVRMDGTVSTLEEAIGTLNGDKKRAGHTSDVVDSSPNLEDKIGVKTKLQQHNMEVLVQNAAEGAIYKTGKVPEWATSKRYSPYLDLEDLQNKADRRQRILATEDRQQEAETRRQNVKTVNDAERKVHDELTETDPDGVVTYKPGFADAASKIRDMPEGRRIGDAMLAAQRRAQNAKPPPVKSDPQVHADLLERLVTPTDNPTSDVEIRTAAAQDQLTPRDTNNLVNLRNALVKAPIRDPVMASTLGVVKATLGTDPIGKGAYASFLGNFLPQYLQLPQDQRAKALDFTDPTSLIRETMKSSGQRSGTQQIIDKTLHKLPTDQGAPTTTTATPTFTPPAGSLKNEARQQIKYPDGSIHDYNGNLISGGTRAVVPASQ